MNRTNVRVAAKYAPVELAYQGIGSTIVMSEPFLLRTAADRVGEHLGISDWVFIDQIQVNVFGEVTRWRTPGHCDPDYMKSSRYGGTLMHGFHMVSKPEGEYLLKTAHEIEAHGVEGRVLYAEYLTYWFPKA